MSLNNDNSPSPAKEAALIQTLTKLTGESEASAKSTLIYLDLLLQDYFGSGAKAAADLKGEDPTVPGGNAAS